MLDLTLGSIWVLPASQVDQGSCAKTSSYSPHHPVFTFISVSLVQWTCLVFTAMFEHEVMIARYLRFAQPTLSLWYIVLLCVRCRKFFLYHADLMECVPTTKNISQAMRRSHLEIENKELLVKTPHPSKIRDVPPIYSMVVVSISCSTQSLETMTNTASKYIYTFSA